MTDAAKTNTLTTWPQVRDFLLGGVAGFAAWRDRAAERAAEDRDRRSALLERMMPWVGVNRRLYETEVERQWDAR